MAGRQSGTKESGLFVFRKTSREKNAIWWENESELQTQAHLSGTQPVKFETALRLFSCRSRRETLEFAKRREGSRA